VIFIDFMHILQRKILEEAREIDLSKCGLRKLGALVGEGHPQKIKHHLEQLQKAGYVRLNDEKTRIIELLDKSQKEENARLFKLPILGSANCGPATMFADEKVEGYLTVSKSFLENKNAKDLFIIQASGDSLNDAKGVIGGVIEDGDLVIIDGSKKNPVNGDYILSVIDDVANLKRFYRKDGEIRLLSESLLKTSPIILDEKDLQYLNYLIMGVVVRVIKSNE